MYFNKEKFKLKLGNKRFLFIVILKFFYYTIIKKFIRFGIRILNYI